MRSFFRSPLSCSIGIFIMILTLGFFMDFSPPVSNSSGLLLANMIIVSLVLLVVYAFVRPLAISWKLRVLVMVSGLSVLSFGFYVSMYADKVINVPPRVIIGSELQINAQTYIKSEIANGRSEPSNLELLESTGGEFSIDERLERIWTRSSIGSVRKRLVVLWTISFVTLACSILIGFEYWLPHLRTPGSLRNQLDGKKLSAVYRALIDAFDGPRLERMTRERMNERLDTIVATGAFSAMVSDLIDWANREGRIDELIEAVCEEVPKNAWVRKLAADYGKPK